jgi:hypothetical protein
LVDFQAASHVDSPPTKQDQKLVRASAVRVLDQQRPVVTPRPYTCPHDHLVIHQDQRHHHRDAAAACLTGRGDSGTPGCGVGPLGALASCLATAMAWVRRFAACAI